MRPLHPVACFLVVLHTTAGCLSTQSPVCLPGERHAIMESIYFGTATPRGVVSPDEWAAFVNDTVTPAFPEGLTSWQASGQWRKQNASIEHKDSHILQLIHEGNAVKNTAIQRLISIYKQRFEQEAVMRVRSGACLSFPQ